MEEIKTCHEMSNHKEGDEKGEQLEPTLHPNPSFDEQEDNHPGDVHEESHPNFPYEHCNEHVEKYVSDIFKEYFSVPICDEYKDDYLNNAPEEPKVCNNGLDLQEEEENSKWDTSLCFLDSEITLLDSMEKHNDIFFKTFVRNQVLNSESLDEEVDVSFTNFQDHYWQKPTTKPCQ